VRRNVTRERPQAAYSDFAIYERQFDILRVLDRARTALTIRLSLSAIAMALFPASAISPNCLSFPGSHWRPVFVRSGFHDAQFVSGAQSPDSSDQVAPVQEERSMWMVASRIPP
jgi:hypothetical protein